MNFSKKIAILQSNYIPWKGYFDIIASVDEFVLFDCMQYTKRDWRNRNLIKTPQGPQWLTIPVQVKGKYDQKIRDVLIAQSDWANEHWKTLLQNYRGTPHFKEISDWLEPIYLNSQHTHLSKLNSQLIQAVCKYLNINTLISDSSSYNIHPDKNQRLISICKQAKATQYLSGPSAMAYIDENSFSDSQILLSWFDYKNYPEYPQMWGHFLHEVSILDLLFNCGKNSPKYMKHQIK